jgi:hypothetical protein
LCLRIYYIIINILTCKVVHATKMTGSSLDDGIYYQLVTHSLLITITHKQYSAITHLQHLQFTVAHALGFPVSTSCLVATDLNTGSIQVSRNHTVPIPLHDSTHKVSTSHLKSSQVDELSSSTAIFHFSSLIPLTLNRELTEN